MKVPPLQNLIVCAIPAQSIVRHFVLAAAAHVFVLCGAASAQSAPVAPPLTLWNAVAVTHVTAAETTGTLEHSADLTLWQVAGDAVYGDGESLTQLIPTAGQGDTGFFRVKTETRPAVGDARWTLTGTRLLVNTKTGAQFLTFSANGAGTANDGTAVRSFTWDWQRTGRNTGSAVITWPDGLSATMALEFKSGSAGVFISELTRDGVPAGVVGGTFRDEEGGSLTATAPAVPGDADLVLAGTGRAQRINLAAVGTAVITGPAGPRSFSAAWALTDARHATLSLSCQDGTTEVCELACTGPACGTYTLTVEMNGRLRRSAEGVFTIAPR